MGDNKVVLVTGCANGGIGYEYCKAFAERNCHVFASDVSQRMHDMLDLSSDNIETLELDVASDESVATAVNNIISKCGRIDILVNNARIGSTGPLAELPLDTIRKAYEINTLGQLRLVQQVVSYMASRQSGSIVNVGSVVGRVPTPWAGSYCASKAAVHAMSNTLRVKAIWWNYDWKLYKEFKEAIAERARASQGGKATDAKIFARRVVKKVSSPRPPKQIIFGHVTGLFAMLSWSPLWVRDHFFATRFNLKKKIRKNIRH
ncbi:hypothetical protein ACB098_02G147900 [Castanea mollissima]